MAFLTVHIETCGNCISFGKFLHENLIECNPWEFDIVEMFLSLKVFVYFLSQKVTKS